MRLKQHSLWGSVLLWVLIVLGGCQVPGTAAPTTVVIVRNAQGTPLAGPGSGPTAIPATPTPAPNLLNNGSFANDWTDGWLRDTGQTINGQSITEVMPSSQGSSGRAVRLVHDGEAFLTIYQVIELASPDVVITADINPTADTPCRGILKSCTGMAGFAIYFLGKGNGDPNKREIGSLIYLYPGSDDNIRQTSTATSRYIYIQPGWQTININLRQEITNSLPGMDISKIKGLMVMIIAGSVGGCDPGKCYAEVQATNIQIAVK